MQQIVAHRVNSIEAFHRAVAAGADAVEFDVQLVASEDTQTLPVLYHNELAQNGKAVSELTLEALQQQTNPDHPGERIVTLDEFLIQAKQCLQKKGKNINAFGFYVELKSQEPKLAAKTLAVLGSHGLLGEEVVMLTFIPAHIQAVENLRKTVPEICGDVLTGLDIGHAGLSNNCDAAAEVAVLPHYEQMAVQWGIRPDIISPRYTLLAGADAALASIKEAGAKTATFTWNDPSCLPPVDAIITDDVAGIKAVLG